MKFRQFGILLVVGGFLTGHLLATMAERASLDLMGRAAGAHDPMEISNYAMRALNFQMWGDIVSLLGLVIYFYGVLTSRGGRNTSIAPT
jgi:hypothetical protein